MQDFGTGSHDPVNIQYVVSTSEKTLKAADIFHPVVKLLKGNTFACS